MRRTNMRPREAFMMAEMFGRRRLLGAGLGGFAALGLPARLALAADGTHPPIGTWPAGVQGDTAFIGITTPLTGPYSADGKDHQLGYELAIAEINAGGGTAAKWGLKG